jgi:hypothetical protein
VRIVVIEVRHKCVSFPGVKSQYNQAVAVVEKWMDAICTDGSFSPVSECLSYKSVTWPYKNIYTDGLVNALERSYILYKKADCPQVGW